MFAEVKCHATVGRTVWALAAATGNVAEASRTATTAAVRRDKILINYLPPCPGRGPSVRGQVVPDNAPCSAFELKRQHGFPAWGGQGNRENRHAARCVRRRSGLKSPTSGAEVPHC